MNTQEAIGGVVIIPFLAEKNRQAVVCLKDSRQPIPRWKFPGGKIFEGENKEAAARRIIHQKIGRTICTPDDYASFTLFEIDVSSISQYRVKTAMSRTQLKVELVDGAIMRQVDQAGPASAML